mgnify:CR=1 FL=1
MRGAMGGHLPSQAFFRDRRLSLVDPSPRKPADTSMHGGVRDLRDPWEGACPQAQRPCEPRRDPIPETNRGHGSGGGPDSPAAVLVGRRGAWDKRPPSTRLRKRPPVTVASPPPIRQRERESRWQNAAGSKLSCQEGHTDQKAMVMGCSRNGRDSPGTNSERTKIILRPPRFPSSR